MNFQMLLIQKPKKLLNQLLKKSGQKEEKNNITSVNG